MTSYAEIDATNFDSVVKIEITKENKYLEFKIAQEAQSGHLIELARDIAQFANSDGGTLLFGVREERDPTGTFNVAKEIVGVPDVEVLRQKIEQAIQNHITPSTFRPTSETIPCSNGKVVVALNVPPSRYLIYVCKREDQGFTRTQKHMIECLHRTNHGKDWMNPDEIERHLMNGSRAAKLSFWEAKKKAAIIKPQVPPRLEIVGGIWVYVGNMELMKRQNTFECALPHEYEDSFEVSGKVQETLRTLTVPYDLIRSTWVDSTGTICLMLSARIVFVTGGSLSLEPL
jgi:hypothetical protein